MTFPRSEYRVKPSVVTERLLSLGATMLRHGVGRQERGCPDFVFNAVATRPRALLGRAAASGQHIVDEAIRATFAAESKNRIEFHSEFLDVSRFPGEPQRQRQAGFFAG